MVVDISWAVDCFAMTFFNFHTNDYVVQLSLCYVAVNATSMIMKTESHDG